MKGRIWEISIGKTELAAYEQRYQVVSSRLVARRPFLHVYSPTPLSEGFAPSTPNLEDFFFTKIRSWN
jgi:ABC-2 type transport system ATP-binding protein